MDDQNDKLPKMPIPTRNIKIKKKNPCHDAFNVSFYKIIQEYAKLLKVGYARFLLHCDLRAVLSPWETLWLVKSVFSEQLWRRTQINLKASVSVTVKDCVSPFDWQTPRTWNSLSHISCSIKQSLLIHQISHFSVCSSYTQSFGGWPLCIIKMFTSLMLLCLWL